MARETERKIDIILGTRRKNGEIMKRLFPLQILEDNYQTENIFCF